MTDAELAALHARAFVGVQRPWTADEIGAFRAGAGIYLVEASGGFGFLRIAGDEGEILTLAVDPGKQRRGIGQRLVAEMVEIARTHGAAHLFLEVAQNNSPGRALYAGCGFEQTGIRKDYYQSPQGARISALVMRRVL